MHLRTRYAAPLISIFSHHRNGGEEAGTQTHIQRHYQTHTKHMLDKHKYFRLRYLNNGGFRMIKSPYGIEADVTFDEAARVAIKSQVDALMLNLEGTIKGDDIEALHDMRVASRRLRAAMSVFSPAFPARQFGVLEKEVARVTDALGEVRDSDVLIEFIDSMKQEAPESEQVGLDAFRGHLVDLRNSQRVVMNKELNRMNKSGFARDFESLLSGSKRGNS